MFCLNGANFSFFPLPAAAAAGFNTQEVSTLFMFVESGPKSSHKNDASSLCVIERRGDAILFARRKCTAVARRRVTANTLYSLSADGDQPILPFFARYYGHYSPLMQNLYTRKTFHKSTAYCC